MKRFISFIMAAALAAMVIPTLAGTLTPPGAPSGGSGMPSTAAIFQQLSSGRAATSATSFQGPSVGPGASGKSLADIQRRLPAPDNTNGAIAAEVKTGKQFWGLRTDGTWGLQTGGYTCATGDLSPAGRWCDNHNGTVRDMTTGLIWLKNAYCTTKLSNPEITGGLLPWNEAVAWAVSVGHGYCDLSDNSSPGIWRLPTKEEVFALITGTEPVLSGTPRAFTSVQGDNYWSSSSYDANSAWLVLMGFGSVGIGVKNSNYYVWPVRSGQ